MSAIAATSQSSEIQTEAAQLDCELADKYARVQALLGEMGRALIAYSGGIDSTLMAKLALDELGAERVLAVTANSPSLMPEDFDEAAAQAAHMGLPHEVVETSELENPDYVSNPVNRCYFCKSELHDTLRPLAWERGYPYAIDGVNADDLHDYRPGVQAAKERGARSPLAEVGITKLEVRQLSRFLGLPWWDKPAQPCLSSRFPYGEGITAEKLARVAAGERYLRNLGWREVRVRSERDTARIEIPRDRIGEFVETVDLDELVREFQRAGFLYVALDLEGLQSGKLNRAIAL
ncbi:MAG: ATP-dependent sacrificial sulfur transferase LarE [Cyanobacteria bacterium J06642_2]